MDTPGRAGLAVAAVAALGGSFLAGAVVTGGLGTTASPPTGPSVSPALRLVNADLTVPGSCEELLESYVERGVEQVGPYGWASHPGVVWQTGGVLDDFGSAMEEGVRAQADAPMPAAPGVVEQGNSATGTNVQEAGVDEPDTVKTDGELLVRVRDGEVVVHDVTGDRPEELAEVDLPRGLVGPELLLAGDTLAVTATTRDTYDPGTRLLTYDLSDPADPVMVDHRGFTTTLVRAVQHDETVRLVLSAGLPDLDFVQPRFWRDEEEATERNREVVRDSTLEDWLPRLTTYDEEGEPAGSEQLLDCGSVTVPAADGPALGTMAVVGFEAADPGDADVLGVATDTRLAYFSPTRMYLATSDVSWWGWDCCWRGVGPESWPGPAGDDAGRSRIYAFGLDDTATPYVASGVVDGTLADRWSMDEHAGVLRLAVGPSQETGNFSSVLTLREDGDELEEIGRVDKLGVNEEIKSVRWFDGLAIVVTFRQVDPLYAIDLSRPGRPELLGELKIPGFSEYLHPIDGQRLIGMGQDATRRGRLLGAQAALFDVSDLTAPRRTDLVHYRKGSVAAAATDPRQFTWLPRQDTALTVVSQGWTGRTGWVSVLRVDGEELSNEMVEVEYGNDVNAVRLVPLPDPGADRVVLVTGEDVSFFDLDR